MKKALLAALFLLPTVVFARDCITSKEPKQVSQAGDKSFQVARNCRDEMICTGSNGCRWVTFCD